jgi:hypothetical protein
VKTLLKILGIGLVAFIAIAMAQEWRLFATAWFGMEAPRSELAEEDRTAAHQAVYRTLSLMEHLYSTGGDTRFADRIPAGQPVLDEILADVNYVLRNGRIQVPDLLRLEIAAVEPLGADAVEVSTREFWRIRFLWPDGSAESDAPREQFLQGRYLVVRESGGWTVQGWEYDLDAGPEDAPATDG